MIRKPFLLILAVLLLVSAMVSSGCLDRGNDEKIVVNETVTPVPTPRSATASDKPAITAPCANHNLGIILGGDAWQKSDSSLASYLDFIHHDLGADLIVFDIDKNPDNNWDDIDRMVKATNNEGFNKIAGIINADKNSLAAFSYEASKRYPEIDVWFLNYNAELDLGSSSDAGILRESAKKIKAKNPKAIVIVGGQSLSDGEWKAPKGFVKRLCQNSDLSDVDAIGITLDTDKSEDIKNLERISAALGSEGYTGRKIWVSAWITSKGHMNETDQAMVLKNLFCEWQKVYFKGYFLVPCSGPDYAEGIFRENGSTKPSYNALKQACI